MWRSQIRAVAQRERERGAEVSERREEKPFCSEVVETAETRPSVAGPSVKLADALSGMRTLMKAESGPFFFPLSISVFYLPLSLHRCRYLIMDTIIMLITVIITTVILIDLIIPSFIIIIIIISGVIIVPGERRRA